MLGSIKDLMINSTGNHFENIFAFFLQSLIKNIPIIQEKFILLAEK